MDKITRVTFLLIFFGLSFTYYSGCGSDSATSPDPTGSTTENGYNIATNFGDVIKFRITATTTSDAANGFNYEWSNQSMNSSGSGSMTLSTNQNLTGVYSTAGGKYIIELPNNSCITTLDFGRSQSNFSFGITSERNLNCNSLIGDYIFINYDEDSTESFGGYRLNANGTATWGMAPYDIGSITNFNYFQGFGSVTWRVSPTDSSRIIFTENGVDYAGTIYPDKYMLISNGTANGITIGIKYPSAPLSISQIAGTYRGFDYTSDGNVGVGRFTIPSTSAPVNYYFSYSSPVLISEGNSSGNIYRHPGIYNCFVMDDVRPGEYDYTMYCIVLSGECLLHFARSNQTNSASSCGFGLKIN